MIATLRANHPAVPIRVGPSTIGVRKSPLGRQPATDGMRRVALAGTDPRCQGLFGAAWTLGYVAQVANAGVDSVTMMSLCGPSGVLGRMGETWTRHPTFLVLSRMRSPARVCAVSVSEPAKIAALAVLRPAGRELLLSNLTGEAIDVTLDGWPAIAGATIMNAESWGSRAAESDGWEAMRRIPPASSLHLTPYAVATLEVSSGQLTINRPKRKDQS